MRSLGKLLMLLTLVSPAAARADWLDLSDGNWDLTMTCVHSALACPATFHASLTISGGGATFLSTVFNNQTFSGDPTDFLATDFGLDEQGSVLVDDPYSAFSINNDLDLPNPFGLADHHWAYCQNFAPDTCSPNTDGNWVAAPVTPVPEPSTLALFAAGLSGLVAMRRRRRRCICEENKGIEQAHVQQTQLDALVFPSRE